MKIFNFVLTIVAVLVAALMLTNLIVARGNAVTQQRLEQAQLAIRNGQMGYALLNNLAARVNQAAATDPALKDVLPKLGINFNANSAPAN